NSWAAVAPLHGTRPTPLARPFPHDSFRGARALQGRAFPDKQTKRESGVNTSGASPDAARNPFLFGGGRARLAKAFFVVEVFAMKCVVTGAAGSIGSHLCEYLLRAGHRVCGLDAFVPYYSPTVKERNLLEVRAHAAFCLHRLDLRSDSLDGVLADAALG